MRLLSSLTHNEMCSACFLVKAFRDYEITSASLRVKKQESKAAMQWMRVYLMVKRALEWIPCLTMVPLTATIQDSVLLEGRYLI
jgi:hypothetical protein